MSYYVVHKGERYRVEREGHFIEILQGSDLKAVLLQGDEANEFEDRLNGDFADESKYGPDDACAEYFSLE